MYKIKTKKPKEKKIKHYLYVHKNRIIVIVATNSTSARFRLAKRLKSKDINSKRVRSYKLISINEYK